MWTLSGMIRFSILLATTLFLLTGVAVGQNSLASGTSRPLPKQFIHEQDEAAGKFNLKFHVIDYPGAWATRAYGINAQGVIVGSFDDSNTSHGFVLRSGEFTEIDVPGSVSTDARGINSRGEIVGWYSDSNFNEHGFLLRAGRFRTIDIPFSTDTRCEGINDASVISGEYVDQSDYEHGYLLRDEEFETFDVPGSFSTDIWMVANDGWFAGDFSSATTVLGFMRNKRGLYISLEYPQSAATAARWINNQHEVVGRWDDTSVPLALGCSTQCHGFLWFRGKFHSIDFPHALSTVSLAINDRGSVVGRFIDPSNNEHGYVARPDGEDDD